MQQNTFQGVESPVKIHCKTKSGKEYKQQFLAANHFISICFFIILLLCFLGCSKKPKLVSGKGKKSGPVSVEIKVV